MNHPRKAEGRRVRVRGEAARVLARNVRWMFAQRLAGHSVARITRALIR